MLSRMLLLKMVSSSARLLYCTMDNTSHERVIHSKKHNAPITVIREFDICLSSAAGPVPVGDGSAETALPRAGRAGRCVRALATGTAGADAKVGIVY